MDAADFITTEEVPDAQLTMRMHYEKLPDCYVILKLTTNSTVCAQNVHWPR